MFTFLLLWSPIIMILIAFVVFNVSKSDLTLNNNGLELIKNSIKYAPIGAAIVFLYSFFSLSLRGQLSIAEIDYESMAMLLFLCPAGFAFGQLVALIQWKYLRKKYKTLKRKDNYE